MLFKKDQTHSKKAPAKTTQSFLRIAEIRDDTIIMDDGTLRAVIAVSSTNFDLKNQDEQNAIIFGYQRFVNSLQFHIQILMQSRKMDIGEYTESLKQLLDKQANELLRVQTAEYIEFINRLVESANVMSKNFYCIVPDDQSINVASTGFLSRLLAPKSQSLNQRLTNFAKYRVLLDQRVISVMSTLSSIGVRVVRLNSPQIIELLYNSYNFAAAPQIDATQLSDITITDETQE